jgi:hypothetical protein
MVRNIRAGEEVLSVVIVSFHASYLSMKTSLNTKLMLPAQKIFITKLNFAFLPMSMPLPKNILMGW